MKTMMQTVIESAMVRLSVEQLDNHQETQMAVNELTAQVMRQLKDRITASNAQLGSVAISPIARHVGSQFVDMTISAMAVLISTSEVLNERTVTPVPSGGRAESVEEIHRITSDKEEASQEEEGGVAIGPSGNIRKVRYKKSDDVKKKLEKVAADHGFVVEETHKESQEAANSGGDSGEAVSSVEPVNAELDLSMLHHGGGA